MTFSAEATRPYLAEVREELPVYADEGIAHPGWVLRLANRILSGNVVLGPWIHVGSDVRHHDLVHDGAKVSCRGTVAEEFERKGHRFVRLDLAVLADEQVVATDRPHGHLPAPPGQRRRLKRPGEIPAGRPQRPTTSGSPVARFTSTPNSRCATRRIWISSDPSVMR